MKKDIVKDMIWSIMFAINADAPARELLLNSTGMKEAYNTTYENVVKDPECMLPMSDRTSAWTVGLNGRSLIGYGNDAEMDYIYEKSLELRNKVKEVLENMDELKLTRLFKKLAAM